ncbi:MAG: hypothetical protein HOV79_15530 [Hamadaea sp.]|nr:hypothetical protein [Hamadaea sp.]
MSRTDLIALVGVAVAVVATTATLITLPPGRQLRRVVAYSAGAFVLIMIVLIAVPRLTKGDVVAQPPRPTSTASPTQGASSDPNPRFSACESLRTAALGEETALLALRNAVVERNGVITSRHEDYQARRAAAGSAVDAAYDRLTRFLQLGGALPPLGEVDYQRDLQRLRDFELQRVDEGDFEAWNELKVYADNAHLVGSMRCD